MNAVFQVVTLLLFDALFIGLCALALWPMSKYCHAAFAVLKRNFVMYFSTPTGYVFLCLFVLLSSFAAFWPHEFFNSNLADLNQLNFWFPFIMLAFIPAITMSIWAEERRDGTDELLLTIPADDLQIVVGKYAAAATIYTVSLLFSQVCNFTVLNLLSLGDLDIGLFVGTYIGYWLVGLAMLAVGMVASFLTSNLTVGFILGMVFNAPLVFGAWADHIIASGAQAFSVSRFSIASQFDDFGRGVVSISSVGFFALVVAIGIYLSYVLIGRRHWQGGRDGQSMLWHFVVRACALIVAAVAVTVYFHHHDWIRFDTTSARINSLAPQTKKLIRELESEQTVKIEAFISADLPPEYVKTKFDLMSMLSSLDKVGGGKIDVAVYDNLELFSREAAMAEKQFGLEPQSVSTVERGVAARKEVLLGAALTCGLEKVVIPFFSRGTPVEYELVRSIRTVALQDRKVLGIVESGAQMFGGFGQRGPIDKQRIVAELEKQFDVRQVDANQPLESGVYDALMVVQPSSLTDQQFSAVLAAIEDGTPTAVFEDPYPIMIGGVTGTSQPRRPRGGMMGMQQPPEPKPNMELLWSLLDIQPEGDVGMGPAPQSDIVWQNYMPYRKAKYFGMTEEWVFVDDGAPGAPEPFNANDSITSGLGQVLFPCPGGIEQRTDEKLEVTRLVTTGTVSGTTPASAMDALRSPFGGGREQLRQSRKTVEKRFCLAVRIRPKSDDADETEDDEDHESSSASSASSQAADDGHDHAAHDHSAHDHSAHDHAAHAHADDGHEAAGHEHGVASAAPARPLHVVYVADVDLLDSAFLFVRDRRDSIPGVTDIDWQFENVTFVLNIIDSLMGDEDLLDIRKRKRERSTLRQIDQLTQQRSEAADKKDDEFFAKFKEQEEEVRAKERKATEKLQKVVDELNKKAEAGEPVDLGQLSDVSRQLQSASAAAERTTRAEIERLARDRDRAIESNKHELEREIRQVQGRCKLLAVILPPIPPLLLAVVVFLRRKSIERESVHKRRRQ